MHSLGKMIKQLRESKHISQKDFAELLGISNVVLSRYENDIRKPDYDILEKIADFFDVSVDYLLGRSAINTMPTRIAEEATALCETQQHVVNRLLRLEDGAFEKQPEEIAEMLEHFEVYWHVHKQMRKGK